ncbi:hypothetical protein M918_17330 [Clostridium sp. BL8]|nr:hypothetical protein M918_17330 [Clostridium sp. BL8]
MMCFFKYRGLMPMLNPESSETIMVFVLSNQKPLKAE